MFRIAEIEDVEMELNRRRDAEMVGVCLIGAVGSGGRIFQATMTSSVIMSQGASS